MRSSNANAIVAYAGGLVFALGLGISGMTLPAKVIGFLDVSGAWDPSLALVMAGAVLTYALMYRLVLRRGHAIWAPSLHISTRRDVDRRLLVGAMLFGVGWGLSGFCPGPALTSLASMNIVVLVFVLAMLSGMYMHRGVEWAMARRSHAASLHARSGPE